MNSSSVVLGDIIEIENLKLKRDKLMRNIDNQSQLIRSIGEGNCRDILVTKRLNKSI